MIVPPRHAAGNVSAWRRLAAVAVLLLIGGAFRSFAPPAVPLALTIAMSAVAGAAALDAAVGLALLAPLLPLGDVFGELSRPDLAWTTPLVFAYAAGRLLAHAAGRGGLPGRPAARHVLPLAVLAVLACASAVVDLAVRQTVTALPHDYYTGLIGSLRQSLFTLPGHYAGVGEALQLMLATALAASAAGAVRSRREGAAAGPLPRLIVAFATTGILLVAVLTWVRVATLALRSAEPIRTALDLALSARIAPAFPDYNAAGTLLGAGLVAGAALGFGTGRRMLAVLSAGVIGPALWLTGSRSALFFLVVLAALAASIRFGRPFRRPTRRRVAIALVLLPLLLVATLWRPRGDPEGSPWRAATLRVQLAAMALRMSADAPLFGVGLGQFYARSAEYASDALRKVYPRENAHNNFLQVLAELGLAGLGALLWVIGIWGVSAWRRIRAPDPVLIAAAGAVTFILGTCLVGHPLLIPEVAFPFWLLLGVSLGWTERADRNTAAPQRWRWALVAVVVIVGAALPWRIAHAIDARVLEHQGAGWSAWQRDQGGTRYRRMGREAHVFVSARAGQVQLLVRAAPGVQGGEVAVSLGGRQYGRVRLTHRWQALRLRLPRAHGTRRLWRLDLHVEGDAGRSGPMAWVGRTTIPGAAP